MTPQRIRTLEDALKSDCASSIEVVLARAGSSERAALRDLLDPDIEIDGHLRVNAIAAAGRLGVTEAVDEIARLLDRLDEHGRLVAADALGRLGGTQAVQLLAQLGKDSSSAVRRFVAIGLGRVGTDEALRVVREIHTNDLDPVVRDTASRILRTP